MTNTAPTVIVDPISDDHVDAMVAAVRRTATEAAEHFEINPYADYVWVGEQPLPPEPQIEHTVNALVVTVANAYAREYRQKIRPLGLTGSATAVLAIIGVLVPFEAVRWGLFGGLGFIAAVTLIAWATAAANSKHRSANELATLEQLTATLRSAAYPEYRFTLRRRRLDLLTSLGIDPNRPSQGPRPEPQPYGVSHQGAEAYCAAWMRHLCATGVTVTQFQGDGGIDITSDRWLAQVKNYAPGNIVGVAEIRDLAGVCSVDDAHRNGLFFTSGTYPAGAVEFANRAGIALFRYDAVAGTISGVNERGRQLLRVGL